ncbi:MAG: discoidin domain-containing protein [Vicinamibacteria bacterium]
MALTLAAGLVVGGSRELAGEEVRNIAGAAQGGRLIWFSSQYDESTWRADNLIDGTANAGWAGQSGGAQAVVVGFAEDRLAEIHDVIVNPYTKEAPANWAKDVEILTSTDYPFKGFASVGKITLTGQGIDQVHSFAAPIRARYVKIVFLSNYGGGYMEAGEIQVMGKTLADSPPAPKYENLAAAKAGAKIERYSSQYNESDWAAANLLSEDGRGQWAGSSGAAQEIVIALPEAAEVSDVGINNYAREDATNWAKEIAVEVSSTYAYKGWEPIGKLTLPKVGDLHVVSSSKPVLAKYVRILFGSNHGGGYMEAARVRVFRTVGGGGGASVAQQLKDTGRAVTHEIHFAFNSAEILPDSEPALKEIAGLMQSNSDWKLIVEGHTDDVGGAEFNQELSRKRASAVEAWLVEKGGLAEERLTTVGYGQSKPIADNTSDDGRAQNRRVELVRE